MLRVRRPYWMHRWKSEEEKDNNTDGDEDGDVIVWERPRSNVTIDRNDEKWVEAECLFRFKRWAPGYLVNLDDRECVGHIIKADAHDVTVNWFCHSTKKNVTETFSRGDEAISPCWSHIIHVLENGHASCVDLECDEEKVDVDGNLLEKVMYHHVCR